MALGASGETRVISGFISGPVWVGMNTGDPGSTGANEVSGGSYGRKLASFDVSGSNPTVASNDVAIDFDQASAPWGELTHFSLWGSESGSDFLGGGVLDSSRSIEIGDVVRIPVGQLQIESD